MQGHAGPEIPAAGRRAHRCFLLLSSTLYQPELPEAFTIEKGRERLAAVFPFSYPAPSFQSDLYSTPLDVETSLVWGISVLAGCVL